MNTHVITKNSVEQTDISWDNTRFFIRQVTLGRFPDWRSKQVVVLNPQEANAIAQFIKGVRNVTDKITSKA